MNFENGEKGKILREQNFASQQESKQRLSVQHTCYSNLFFPFQFFDKKPFQNVFRLFCLPIFTMLMVSYSNIHFCVVYHKVLVWTFKTELGIKITRTTHFYDEIRNRDNSSDCLLLSCHIHILERIYALQLAECQGTPCSKQARYPRFKWLQRDSNPQLINS